jgi:hypothetical protein
LVVVDSAIAASIDALVVGLVVATALFIVVVFATFVASSAVVDVVVATLISIINHADDDCVVVDANVVVDTAFDVGGASEIREEI